MSDLADGAISRSHGPPSSLGRFLDPLADKVFVFGVIATLIGQGALGLREALLLGLRDLTVLAGVAWFLVQGRCGTLRNMKPRWLGKCATAAQFVFLLALLIGGWVSPLFYLTTAVSGLAALDYLYHFTVIPPCGERR